MLLNKAANKCNQTAESHMIKELLSRCQSPGEGFSVMRVLTLFMVVWLRIQTCDAVWTRATLAVSGFESIFNFCPPQVQSQLPDIVNMC